MAVPPIPCCPCSKPSCPDNGVAACMPVIMAENRQHLKEHQLLDGIMRKARRNRPLSEAQTKRNRYLSKTRYVVEQSFGTLHRKFRYVRAAYFGLIKVSAQSHLKAMCLNLLKAANRLSAPAAA
ncbi:transposase [Neisseria meningitidis]|uniref:transposase n=1 Tax=Neisseria meningitidis TaxID=487 RepID=UPI003C6E3CDF